MLRGLFQRKPKHERLEEEPEVRFKGLLVSEKDLPYRYVRPGGKTVRAPDLHNVINIKWATGHTAVKLRSTSELIIQ